MLDALGFVIDFELARAGKTRADLARGMGVAESTVKRRLDGSAGALRVGGLDAFVDAVADLLDIPVLKLWEAAVEFMRQRSDWPEERWTWLQSVRQDVIEQARVLAADAVPQRQSAKGRG